MRDIPARNGRITMTIPGEDEWNGDSSDGKGATDEDSVLATEEEMKIAARANPKFKIHCRQDLRRSL